MLRVPLTLMALPKQAGIVKYADAPTMGTILTLLYVRPLPMELI
jgi:hypothetical protein